MRNKYAAFGAIVLGLLYLINPGAGVIELIPDNIPGIGNLDEAGATALLIWGASVLRGMREAPKLAEPVQRELPNPAVRSNERSETRRER
jgi:uncharacterized membrane protein YkvA (DUF1232 family)